MTGAIDVDGGVETDGGGISTTEGGVTIATAGEGSEDEGGITGSSLLGVIVPVAIRRSMTLLGEPFAAYSLTTLSGLSSGLKYSKRFDPVEFQLK